MFPLKPLKLRTESIGQPGAKPDFSEYYCKHKTNINEINLPNWVTVCAECYEQWLKKYSLGCVRCGEPILPFEKVAETNTVLGLALVHLRKQGCQANPTEFAGIWGQGRLISLHELHPKIYSPGTRTLIHYAELTGKKIITAHASQNITVKNFN